MHEPGHGGHLSAVGQEALQSITRTVIAVTLLAAVHRVLNYGMSNISASSNHRLLKHSQCCWPTCGHLTLHESKLQHACMARLFEVTVRHKCYRRKPDALAGLLCRSWVPTRRAGPEGGCLHSSPSLGTQIWAPQDHILQPLRCS